MSFNSQSDFTGDVNITQSSDIAPDFAKVITDTEKKYLRLLLGDDLYLLFIDDLDAGVPQTEKYVNLLDGENYENGGYTWIYEGLKRMLRYFTFAEWKLVHYASDTNIGTVRKTKDTSENLTKYDIEKESFTAFNKGIVLYNQAFQYLDFMSISFETWIFTELKKKSHFQVL